MVVDACLCLEVIAAVSAALCNLCDLHIINSNSDYAECLFVKCHL